MAWITKCAISRGAALHVRPVRCLTTSAGESLFTVAALTKTALVRTTVDAHAWVDGFTVRPRIPLLAYARPAVTVAMPPAVNAHARIDDLTCLPRICGRDPARADGAFCPGVAAGVFHARGKKAKNFRKYTRYTYA